jgi:hypothetical protein
VQILAGTGAQAAIQHDGHRDLQSGYLFGATIQELFDQAKGILQSNDDGVPLFKNLPVSFW